MVRKIILVWADTKGHVQDNKGRGQWACPDTMGVSETNSINKQYANSIYKYQQFKESLSAQGKYNLNQECG